MGEAARSRVMADYDWQNTLSKLNVLLD
jgi:hypothetical protein